MLVRVGRAVRKQYTKQRYEHSCQNIDTGLTHLLALGASPCCKLQVRAPVKHYVRVCV